MPTTLFGSVMALKVWSEELSEFFLWASSKNPKKDQNYFHNNGAILPVFSKAMGMHLAIHKLYEY